MTATKPNKTSAPRGAGGELPPAAAAAADPARGELRLIERAVRQRWEIPESSFKVLPLEMLTIVASRESDGKTYRYKPRERIMAARVLTMIHAQNQADSPATQTHVHAHEHRIELSVEDRRAAFLTRLDPKCHGRRS